MTIDPRFERSVHRWLRAYPRRWRTTRADELTALLADLAAPDATRVDVRTAVGLVRGGWATRARTRPPLLRVLAYRLFDRRLPAQYRGWVRDDLEAPSHPLRVIGSVFAVMGVVSVLIPLATGGRPHGPTGGTLAVVLGMTTGLLARGRRQFRTQARKHLVPEHGEEVTADSLLFGWVMRERLTARAGTGMLTPAVAVVGLAAVVACVIAPASLGVDGCGTGCIESVTSARADAPPALLAVLGAALLAGGGAGLLARFHLRRLVPVRPAQNARRLVAPTSRHRMLTGVLSLCVGGIAWLEGSGRADLFFGVVIAVAAVLVLPTMVVAWRVARTGPDDLALVDVLTIAATGHVPRVDTYREGFVPALLATD